MAESTLLISLSPGELRELIAGAVRESVEAAIQALPQPPRDAPGDDLLSRAETAARLRVSSTTLNDWDHKGILRPHRVGRRVLYKSSDIELALKGRR